MMFCRFLLFILFFVGCGDSEHLDGSLMGSQRIFAVSCTTSDCHGGSSPEANLSLKKGEARAALVNVKTVSYCGSDGVRVIPGDPENSCLWQLIRDDVMPLEGRPLSSSQKKAIYQWIVAGAPE